MTAATLTLPTTIRWTRPVAFGLAAVLVTFAASRLATVNAARPDLLASDVVKGYLPAAQRFLDTGSPYEAYQLAGPWQLGYHTFIHPPSALPLLVPFLVLPLVLWWAIPLAITGWAVYRLRPAPWTWPVMALCLAWPRSTGALLSGNSDLWAMAFLAAGAVIGWPVVLLALKPTFAPLALLGVRRPSAWVAGCVGLVLVAFTFGLWLQWWTVVTNVGVGWWYSVANLPLVLLPVIAYAGRAR